MSVLLGNLLIGTWLRKSAGMAGWLGSGIGGVIITIISMMITLPAVTIFLLKYLKFEADANAAAAAQQQQASNLAISDKKN